MSEETVVVEKKKDAPSENKEICDIITTLEDLLTAVKPMKKDGFQEGTIWMPALSRENQVKIEEKLMYFVNKLK